MITNDAVTDFIVILDIWGPTENKGVFSLGSEDNLILSIEVRRVSLVAQRVKHLPTMWETSVRSLGWEDPME